MTWEDQLIRSEGGAPINRYDNIAIIMRGMWGHELRYNLMAEVPELRGRAYDKPELAAMRETICRVFGMKAKAEDVSSAALQVAYERQYHPVQDYLAKLEWDEVPRLAEVPRTLFGHPAGGSGLAGKMVERWAIAAVARAFEPGCQVDTVLILQSEEQGFRKSTFFREMGAPWSGEGGVDTGREGCFALAGQWIWCWDELAGMLQTARTRGMTEINGFVTRQWDIFRAPYRPNPIKHYRSTVLAGTVNTKQILDDPTGDRRWWIVEVMRKIGDGETAGLRDLLWSEAVALYRAGKASALGKAQWWFDEDEEALRAREAEQYHVIGGWDEPLAAWLQTSEASSLLAVQGFVTVGDALAGLGVRVESRRDRTLQTEIGQSFRRLRWEAPRGPDGRPQRPRVNGVKASVYRPPTSGA